MVAEVVRDAAHAAVFNLLCILDGVAVMDDSPHTELVLTAVEPDARSSVLASPQNVVELHDEFNALVHPPSELELEMGRVNGKVALIPGLLVDEVERTPSA